MRYGVSIPKLPRRVYDRIIIPGLIPTRVMSYVSLGMSRPDWIKFIVAAVAHNNLDLSEPLDKYRLIFDESWGLLFQAFSWKREAEEAGDNSSGYGVGSMQIQSSGSLAVLQDDVSSDRLFMDVVNDIMLKLRRGTVKECAQDFRRCFDPKPDFNGVYKRLDRLVNKSATEKKKGILSAFVWAIDEALKYDHESFEARSNAFTIPNQFLSIVEDTGAMKHSGHTKVLSILYSEKPGDMSRGLSSLEVAALIHELLKGKRSNAIVLSFAVFDLVRDKLPADNIEDVDFILRDAYRRLPEDEKILKYLRRLYERVSRLLSQYLVDSSIMPYSEFLGLCGPERIKRIAVLWEYNLVAGDLEEMLRLFIKDTNLVPPYAFSFNDRWNDLFDKSEEYWRDVISRFEELANAVINDETYLSSFQSEEEYFLDLPSWFEAVERELSANADLESKIKALLKTAGSIGEAIRFNGKTVKVLKKPSATHPLIARGAFYEWLRTFATIWG